ncbi:YgaP family membrane protein [Nitratifractor sp.]
MAINAKKMAKFCRPFRIVLGLALIAAGYYTGIKWFYLGILPLIAGIVGFCPACAVTGQCTILGKDKEA